MNPVEISEPKSKEVIQAQLEIINGYYGKIFFCKEITRDEIMDMLFADFQYLQGEIAVLTAQNLINPK